VAHTPRRLDSYSALAEHSIRLITGLQTPEGAYPASPTFSAYVGYSWLRDGAFIADAASIAGAPDSATAFFQWCANTIARRRDTIMRIVAEAAAGRPVAASDMLPARFTFAGEDGVDEWWDFQLDGYGTWIWALAAHLERHGLPADRFVDAVGITVDYLVASWQRPCYDWWEEHSQHVHISTLACVEAGLRAASVAGLISGERRAAADDAARAIAEFITERGVADGHLVKWVGSTAVDGSLAAALAPLGVIDARSAVGRRTIGVLESHLAVTGGVHRYLGDTFFGGGQWPLLSCFLGLAHLAAGDRDRAEELFAWSAATATDTGDMPEQVGEHLIAPGMRQQWIDKWGPVATPLLWSHAMFLRLGVELGAIDPAALTAAAYAATAPGQGGAR